MPKELTHLLIADRALQGLPSGSPLRILLESHLSVYRAGAVLPDTLLHMFHGPCASAARALAHTFHDASGNSFAPLIRAEESIPGSLPHAMLACLLGVITHIETDIVFHPFVFALTGAAGIARHYRIETDIDCCFLRSGTIPATTQMSDMISPDSHDTIITAISLLFDPTGSLPRPVLEQALAEHCRVQTMYDKAFWKLAVRFLAIIKGSPYRDQQHLFYPLLLSSGGTFNADRVVEWQHPASGETQHGSLAELAGEAVQRTTRLFVRIEETGSLAAALGNSPAENLLTGLHGITHSEISRQDSE
jgi:hypothetical protein